LRRVLRLQDLIFAGIVQVGPVAVLVVFGIAQELSRGHTVTTLLVGMLPILATAISYGRMASLYPAAGSAYTYVGRGLNAPLGFLAGWAMFLGYLVCPLLNVILIAVTIQREFPFIPYMVGLLGSAALITFLNLCGIRWTARSNDALLGFMFVISGIFIGLGIRYLLHFEGWRGLISLSPFYDPKEFGYSTMATATAFATLTYLGFDGLTTLAEDVENPRRNILLSIVVVVLFTAFYSGLLAYVAQLVWPDYHFDRPETAFMDVSRRVGGILLYHAMWVVFILLAFGSALNGQVAAARILFGMGRDNVLPRKIFAYLHPGHDTPVVNIAIIGLLTCVASRMVDFERCAEIMNSGALLAFMGVNVAMFWQFYIVGRAERKGRFLADAVIPLLGFVSCFWIWVSLPRQALEVSGLWLLGGLVMIFVKTSGFWTTSEMVDFSET
jgi:putrescine importer